MLIADRGQKVTMAEPLWKGGAAIAGAVLTAVLPTPILITLLYCVMVAAVVDTMTGIQAAIENREPVGPRQFIAKAGKKLVRGTAYMAIAWVLGQMIGSVMPGGKPVAEPIGGVLLLLATTDMLSSLKNLARAKNNIPIVDRYLTGLVRNLRHLDEPDGKKEKKKQ